MARVGGVFPLQPWGRQARAEGIQKSGVFKVEEAQVSGGAAWLLAGMGTGELSPGVDQVPNRGRRRSLGFQLPTRALEEVVKGS